MEVKLVSVTQPVGEGEPEDLMAYCARVSSPQNQGKDGTRLLQYCLRHKHWSVFEMADMTLEITTSRAISAQILRHRSFSFQEFSQRYSEIAEFETYRARRQDTSNRQNSIDDLSKGTRMDFVEMQEHIQDTGYRSYQEALSLGIAKEQARMLLPMSTRTKIYMKGSVRSWLTYCMVRCEESTQKEHRDIATECQRILIEQFPSLSEVLDHKE